jgi:hypothetical protein
MVFNLSVPGLQFEGLKTMQLPMLILKRLIVAMLLLTVGCSELTEDFISPSIDAETASMLTNLLAGGETDAFQVMLGEKLLVSWGEVDSRTNAASVRKSLVSGLFGIAIDKGFVNPNETLKTLGIREKTMRLSSTEETATVLDLLKARSGVYLPSIGESPGMADRKPARGSVGPGEAFYYNNWDFNVLGTIFENETDIDIGAAFNNWIALPLGMQDFQASDVRYQEEAFTEHRMYRFYISARDLARFGSLYTNKGRWQGEQVIPESWIADTFTKYSEVPYASNVDGYGYLWWIDSEKGRFWAEGSGGQYLMVDPQRKLVMVSRNDTGIELLGYNFHNPFAKAVPFEEIDQLWDIVAAVADHINLSASD